jgi:predicted nucleic-acid-binding Zn-ribbon protein
VAGRRVVDGGDVSAVQRFGSPVMARNEMPCPKCSGKMQEGFIYDQSDAIRLVSKWVEGVPEKSIWTGLKLKGRKTIETRTFRCDKCGFLESYAKEQAKDGSRGQGSG